ncbi:type 1 fimbrial protein [Pseudomonas orientalis]|uniref:fimbrial protein n=1 Tax=Pseudomonas orientalis TaxID=76758 RepID=UPI001FB01B4B|nr:fimbrial protein [Pseudomonas orientalis]UOB22179.1 type 1 fimbrial protein [Pseudomonas orientalis]
MTPPFKKLRNTVATLLTLAAFYATSAAAATCTTQTETTLLNLPDMTVRHDTPIGAEIGATVISPPVNAFSCTNGWTYQETFVKALGAAAAQINGNNIYKFGTANAGIGYAVYGQDCGTRYVAVNGTDSAGSDFRKLCAVNGTFSSSSQFQRSLKLVFYKIGTITPGRKSGQAVAEMHLRNNRTSWQSPASRVSASGFTVNSLGCYVSKTEVDVPMGEVEMQRLHPLGSTVGEREFSIPLNCDIGTKVKLTLTPGTSGVYDNTKGLINLANPTSASTAQGVKIQLVTNDVPVIYDKPLEMGVQTGKGIFTIPLTARYYRSQQPLKAGIANSSVIYTITYE